MPRSTSKDRTAAQPAGGAASGRGAKILRRVANSVGSQASVFIPVIVQRRAEVAGVGSSTAGSDR